MTTDVREALARYSRVRSGEECVIVYDCPGNTSLGNIYYDRDCYTLAAAFAATVREDDVQPTTREWLESIGFVTEGGRFVRGQLQFTYHAGWNAWWAVSGHPHASSRLVDGLNTRSRVRQLLAALGLTETGS